MQNLTRAEIDAALVGVRADNSCQEKKDARVALQGIERRNKSGTVSVHDGMIELYSALKRTQPQISSFALELKAKTFENTMS